MRHLLQEVRRRRNRRDQTAQRQFHDCQKRVCVRVYVPHDPGSTQLGTKIAGHEYMTSLEKEQEQHPGIGQRCRQSDERDDEVRTRVT